MTMGRRFLLFSLFLSDLTMTAELAALAPPRPTDDPALKMAAQRLSALEDFGAEHSLRLCFQGKSIRSASRW